MSSTTTRVRRRGGRANGAGALDVVDVVGAEAGGHQHVDGVFTAPTGEFR